MMELVPLRKELSFFHLRALKKRAVFLSSMLGHSEKTPVSLQCRNRALNRKQPAGALTYDF